MWWMELKWGHFCCPQTFFFRPKQNENCFRTLIRATFQPKDDNVLQWGSRAAVECKFLPFQGVLYPPLIGLLGIYPPLIPRRPILLTRTTFAASWIWAEARPVKIANLTSSQGTCKGVNFSGQETCKGEVFRGRRPVLALSSAEVGMVRTLSWQLVLKRYLYPL